MSRFFLTVLFTCVIVLSVLLAGTLAGVVSNEIWDPHGVGLLLVAHLVLLGLVATGSAVLRAKVRAPATTMVVAAAQEPAALPPLAPAPTRPAPAPVAPPLTAEPAQPAPEGQWLSEEGVQPVPVNEEEQQAAAEPAAPAPHIHEGAAQPPAPAEPVAIEPPQPPQEQAPQTQDQWVNEEGVQDSPLSPTEEPAAATEPPAQPAQPAQPAPVQPEAAPALEADVLTAPRIRASFSAPEAAQPAPEGQWLSEEGVQPVPVNEEEQQAAAASAPATPHIHEGAAQPPVPAEPVAVEPPQPAQEQAPQTQDQWVNEEGVQESPLSPTEEPASQPEPAPAPAIQPEPAPQPSAAIPIQPQENAPMTYRIEIRPKAQFGDPHADGVLHQIRELGIQTVGAVRSSRLFFVFGELSDPQADRVARELLIDPVVEDYTVASTPEGSLVDQGPSVIEVHLKAGVMDPVAASTEKAIRGMGLDCRSVRTGRRYELEGTFTPEQRETVARRLLANAVIEDVYFAARTPTEMHGHGYQLRVVEVPIRDLDEAGLMKLSKDGHLFLNLTEMKAIQDHYRSLGREPRDVELEMIAQTWSEHCVHKTFRSDVSYSGLPIPGNWERSWTVSSADELPAARAEIVQTIQDAGYTGDMLEEGLAGAEKAVLAALSGGPAVIRLACQKEGASTLENLYVGEKRVFGFTASKGGTFRIKIPNLIKSTIFGATQKLNKPWCISVFKDNAGVIEFDQTHAVCFKVETHNHPSAIEPYGGASTGIGGVIRDPMGTGMGAAPVANTDIFCFGRPDMKLEEVPKGVLHPRRVMRGVVSGVRDYGNRMGIPTVNGAVYFDDRYLGNPLVFCGTVGILPREKCFKDPRPGDAVVVVGGRTGRDGIHGATFSSGELTHSHETEFSHAVQIGNAITEKKMLDTILQARDLGLYTAITDCGAGGLSSAVGEMGSDLGAEVHLDRVPLKYSGLSYAEIWISEAQERMVLSVPQENLDRILKIFCDEDVEAVVIGHYGTPDRHLRLYYQGTEVGDVDLHFLNEGLPRPTKEAVWNARPMPSPAPGQKDNYNATLLAILGSPNVASKEWIIRQYDHEVQGGSVVKPLVGVTEDGPGDAAVLRPVLGSQKAVVVSCGMNPRLGDLDPYQSALHSVDEALRNAVAVGGRLDRTAILDNFCWGNCNKPDRMGSLVLAACGCHDAALAYGTPFISGKDSLNNEFQTETGETIAIPPTLLVSAISVIDDASRCVTADAKEGGNYLFVLGRTGPEMGGSHYLLAEGLPTGNDVPPVDLQASRKVMLALENAIQAGCVRACHDLSEGGLAVAAAEMAFSGGLGVEINVEAMPVRGLGVPAAALLFGESAGRFLVEVPAGKYGDFLRLVKDCPAGEVGKVTKTGRVILKASRGKPLVDVTIEEAKKAWQGTFAE